MLCQGGEGHLKDILLPAGGIILHTEGGVVCKCQLRNQEPFGLGDFQLHQTAVGSMTFCSRPGADAASTAADVYALALTYELKT